MDAPSCNPRLTLSRPGLSQLDELGSHLVLPVSSKSTRLFPMRELSSLSSSKASLSLSSHGEPSLTANSNLSRQFSVCQAAEPTHRFNRIQPFLLWMNANLTIVHVPREHRHGPADINLSLLHPSCPLSKVPVTAPIPPLHLSLSKARTFEHRFCHSLPISTPSANL